MASNKLVATMKMPMAPPAFEHTIDRLINASKRGPEDLARILTGIGPVDQKGRYLHWDDMRNRTPPDGFTHDEWWTGTTLSRRALTRSLPLTDAAGKNFRFSNIDQIQEMVHRIDQRASGQIMAGDIVTSLRSSDRYLVSSLVEEAITSSQLEGASTTRRVAKELLASGRAPRDRSERMIVNNFQAMVFAQELSGAPLAERDVLDLHRIVTDGTLDDPNDAGRLQEPGEDRIAVYWKDGSLLHNPPDASELPARLTAMCKFANGELSDGFLHPVVRAIVLHFWLAYDHPFVDGNGRTTRALFYWSMLNSGYWLTQYLSVSSILRKAPSKYARSYLLVETDDNDLTYFVMYQLGVIERAIDSLHAYLARKIAEMHEIEQLIHGSNVLNNRQLVAVQHALRDPSEQFTVAAQRNQHRVTYESARSDLVGLERLGLFTKQKVGKKYVFRPQRDLPERLRQLGA
jgi:Fic family protein